MKPVVLVERDGAIGRIVLNRPEAMNAVTVELGAQLHDALVSLGADPAINVITIRGAGGNFSVGGDFGEVERLIAAGHAELKPLFENFGRACEAIGGLAVPVVALVEGYAMAGGFELALACDIALVRDEAKLADNHANFGWIPGGGSTQRLARLVGRQRALGVILSGERLTGAQAAEWGLAYRSLAAADFEAEATAFVDRLAAASRAAAGRIKQLVYDGSELPLAAGLAAERTAVVEFIMGDAGTAAVAAFKTRET
ncbi:MAG TPA: enoyl-CoA hydratase/isomerase family protein [Mycobacteriales bacterium]|nr:enoyl-CoA hydratase/isomerase family protein [Mycobacteriales bacterium]